jgi:hypothetical protein
MMVKMELELRTRRPSPWLLFQLRFYPLLAASSPRSSLKIEVWRKGLNMKSAGTRTYREGIF